MAIREIKAEVIKLDDGLAIPLPLSFCEGTTLEAGSEVQIRYTKRGSFELQVIKHGGRMIQCQICEKRTGKYSCRQCGRIACSNCFWEWGGLCNKCAHTKK